MTPKIDPAMIDEVRMALSFCLKSFNILKINLFENDTTNIYSVSFAVLKAFWTG